MDNRDSKLKKLSRNKKIVIFTILSVISVIVVAILLTKTNLRRLLSDVSDSEYNSKDIIFDNNDSEIESSNMQDAIDELYTKCLELKEKCPDGYICTSKEDKDSKDKLKEKIKEKEELLLESYDEELESKINEAKSAIYDDDFEKIKELVNEL